MVDEPNPEVDRARSVELLQYVPRPSRNPAVLDASYWLVDIVLAVINVLFNAACIAWAIAAAHESALSAKLLLIDPSAFGRRVDAALIVRLQNSLTVWAPAMTVCASAIFGLFLAMRLLMIGWYLRTMSPRAVPVAASYGRFKSFGIVLMSVSLYWFMGELQSFWIAATRHIPIGTHSPAFEVAVVAIFSLLPWWIFAGVRLDSKIVRRVRHRDRR